MGIVDVDASPIVPHDRDAVHVESHVVGISNRGRAAASLQDAVDVPMLENGPGEVPLEQADREQLRTLLANLDAPSQPRPAGGADVCQILQAKQEKRKRVQAQLSALRPLKTRLREAHHKADEKYKALVEVEESVKALLLAKQKLTQQAKEARDANAKELEEVDADARTAREGSAQSAPNSSTMSPSPMSPAQDCRMYCLTLASLSQDLGSDGNSVIAHNRMVCNGKVLD